MAAEDDFLHPRSLAIGLGAGVGDAGAFDQGGFGDVNLAPPASGLGLAGARDDQDLKYLQGLPTAQKIGLALQAFSAGVAGRPSPIDAVLERARAQRTERRQDLQRTIETISKGMEVMRKLPMGTTERDAMGKVLSDAVGGGEIGKVFQVAGQQGEEEVRRALRTFDDPDVREKLLNACASAADFNACILTQARDKDFMVRTEREVNAKRMPAILGKLSKLQDRIKEGALKEYAGEDGKLNISFAKLMELNAKAGVFTEHEMDTIRDNQGMLIDYGIRTEKSLQAGQEKREKVAAGEERYRAVNFMLPGQKKPVAGRIDSQGNKEILDDDGEWQPAPRGTSIGGAESARPAAGPKGAKGLTASQERANAETDAALERLKARGIVPGTPEGEKKLGDLVNKELPNRRDNKAYVGDAMAGRLRKDYATAAREKYSAGGAAAAQAQAAAPAAAKSAGKPTLTEAQRKQVLDAVNAALQKGADPAAVKKWAKDKHGLDLILK